MFEPSAVKSDLTPYYRTLDYLEKTKMYMGEQAEQLHTTLKESVKVDELEAALAAIEEKEMKRKKEEAKALRAYYRR